MPIDASPMTETTYVFDATTATFEAEVLQKSLQTPVLVDDGEIEPLMASDEELSEESEEDALARAIAEEHAQQEADA